MPPTHNIYQSSFYRLSDKTEKVTTRNISFLPKEKKMTTSAPNFSPESIKLIAESTTLKSVPSQFKFLNDNKGSTSDSIPIIDYSLLTAGTPDQRSQVLCDLTKACQDWGFFVLVNHGIPETLLKNIIQVSLEFFELEAEEKSKYASKSVSDPIKSGTGSVINTANYKINLWRDYIKSYVHPEFHCPDKPESLRETVFEYSEKSRVVVRKLLEAISENLGLEKGHMDEVLMLDSHYQLYAANYYPPCPEPDQAIGIPPHTDYGLLTFLIHNGVSGLQIEHNKEWFDTDSPQNSILVNTGEHLQIFSNGRYTSVKHRAVVNTEATRVSVVLAHGAAPDAIVGPSEQLVERDGRALYRPMKFIDYVETLMSNTRIGSGILESLKIEVD